MRLAPASVALPMLVPCRRAPRPSVAPRASFPASAPPVAPVAVARYCSASPPRAAPPFGVPFARRVAAPVRLCRLFPALASLPSRATLRPSAHPGRAPIVARRAAPRRPTPVPAPARPSSRPDRRVAPSPRRPAARRHHPGRRRRVTIRRRPSVPLKNRPFPIHPSLISPPPFSPRRRLPPRSGAARPNPPSVALRAVALPVVPAAPSPRRLCHAPG